MTFVVFRQNNETSKTFSDNTLAPDLQQTLLHPHDVYTTMVDLEAQNTDFDSSSSSLATQLYELSSKVNSLNKLLTRHKSKHLNTLDPKIITIKDEAIELCKISTGRLKAITEEENISKQQGLVRDRLTREFTSLLGQFRRQQREIAELERASVFASKTAQLEEEQRFRQNSENTPLLQSDNQGSQNYTEPEVAPPILDMVSQEYLDTQNMLIQEREQGIQDIMNGISEINAIFGDLGVLVSQQGEHLDTFENNVSDLAANTKQAGDELVAANEYQRKKMKCSACVLAVLVIVLSVIVLLALVS